MRKWQWNQMMTRALEVLKEVGIGKYQTVLIEQILVDPERQREGGETWCEQRYFVDVLAGPVRLSLRQDGKYRVMDGQRRIYMAKMARRKKIRAEVWENLSLDQESALFYLWNTQTTRPKAYDCYKQALNFQEPIALKAKEVVESVGYKIDGHREDGNIRAVTALYTIMQKNGKIDGYELLRQTLIIIREAYGDASEALDGVMIQGLALFLEGNKIDRQRLIDKLKRTPVGKIRTKAVSYMTEKGAEPGRDTAYREAFKRIYRRKVHVVNEVED